MSCPCGQLMCAPYLRWREAHDFTVTVVDGDGDSWFVGALTDDSRAPADDLEMHDRRTCFRDWVRHLDVVGGAPLPLFGSLVEMLPLGVAA